MENNFPAVFPLAGMGSRFFPSTKTLAKEMLPLNAKPSLEYALEDVFEAGTKAMVFVLPGGINSNYKDSINQYFNNWSSPFSDWLESPKAEKLKLAFEFSKKISIEPCYQKEAKGLGHAILQAKDAVLEKNAQQFFTLLPDDIIDSKPSSCFKLKSYLDKYKASGAILVQDVPLEKTDCYGVIDAESLENNGEICKIKSLVEKPQPSNAPSTLAVVGRYILPCSIFDELEKTKPGKGGEIQLTDAINSICKKEKIISVKLSGQRLDTGTPLGYNLACLWYGLKDPDQKKALKEAFNQWT